MKGGGKLVRYNKRWKEDRRTGNKRWCTQGKKILLASSQSKHFEKRGDYKVK